ncbi:MAG: nucleotidyltransferase domain-containing protein [Bacteroidales bacterium]|nr:nucleotidyltransferase domain-containing protein [Bacteroidales bacterium]
MSLIERNIDQLRLLCAKHSVKQLAVFGSILTNRFRDDSDVDFLVSFNNIPLEEYADNYLQLMTSISMLLGRDIDLVEEKAISNPVFKNNVDRTKMMIYG